MGYLADSFGNDLPVDENFPALGNTTTDTAKGQAERTRNAYFFAAGILAVYVFFDM